MIWLLFAVAFGCAAWLILSLVRSGAKERSVEWIPEHGEWHVRFGDREYRVRRDGRYMPIRCWPSGKSYYGFDSDAIVEVAAEAEDEQERDRWRSARGGNA